MATAAHCVCMHEPTLVKCKGGKIKYDAGEVIRVFVGLNTQDITVATARHRRLHEKLVDEVWSEYIDNGIKFIALECEIPSQIGYCAPRMEWQRL